jgi:hypothetical protein
MALSAAAVAYTAVGGLVCYSGIKGATLAATAKAVLSGNLALSDTETVTSAAAAADSSAGTASEPASASASANQADAKKIATSMGLTSWTTGTEWTDWVKLWDQESGWSTTAQNPTSTAYGIAQFLDTTWATVGGTKTSDPGLQIKYGIEYIQQRYGSPSLAWAHEVENDWY